MSLSSATTEHTPPWPFKEVLQWLAAIFLLAAPPLVTNNVYYVSLATDVLIASILTLSLNLVVGKSGQFAVAHAAFYGIGAYVAGVLAARSACPDGYFCPRASWAQPFLPSSLASLFFG